MKKLIIACVGLLLSFQALQAQETRFGVRGGLNFSNFIASEPDDTNLRTGLNIGLTTKTSLINEMLFLQAELGYSGKGSKVEGQLGDVSLNMGYIDVPVMLSVGFANAVFLEGGVYAGYLTNASISGETSGGSSFSESISTSDFNRFDYGWVLGASLDLKPFVVGARYNYGLRNIVDSELVDTLGSRARNSVFQVYVGLSF